MRYVSISAAKPGMQLARTVYDNSSNILIMEGMSLTQEYISRLKKRGFPGIYIEDELSKNIVIHDVISTQLRNHAVAQLTAMNIDDIGAVAKDIVQQILENRAISLDVMDLRSFDDYTARHSVSVAVLATIIGIGFELTEDELIDLCVAGLLHDIGKKDISGEILNKPSKLTDEERLIVQKHAYISYEMIKDRWDIAATTKCAVLYHHENFDGTGYPAGIEGEDIHLYARILRVADAYDALTANRPYKKAYLPAEAMEYLMGGCRIFFDTNVVEKFLMYVPAFPKGSTVLLSDGSKAIVADNTRNYFMRPVVIREDGTRLNLYADPTLRSLTIKGILDMDYASAEEILENEKGRQPYRKQILLVDSNEMESKMIAKALRPDYKVIRVMSGLEAIDYLNQKDCDLLFVDIDMKGLDGLKTVEEITKKRNKAGKTVPPVIFISRHNDRDTIMKCKALNAQDYVVRPANTTYIKTRVSTALGDTRI